MQAEVADVRAAMLRGLAFAARYGPSPACWRECAADVAYMFFHLSTRPGDELVRGHARPVAMRLAGRWQREHGDLPEHVGASDLLFWHAYGTYTPTRLGLDTRRVRRDLARACRRFGPVDFFGFDPRREAPPSRLRADGERLNRYQVWQNVLVGAHLGEELGLDVGCSVDDAVGWRGAMQPYPSVARGLGWNAWCAFYAVTHLVYVLGDYSLYRLPLGVLEPERVFVRDVCRRGIARTDVEVIGESVDVLLALGEDEHDPLVTEASEAILAMQNRDGSWGDRGDVPYTRFHKTWVALDGLTRYGKRRLRRPALGRAPHAS